MLEARVTGSQRQNIVDREVTEEEDERVKRDEKNTTKIVLKAKSVTEMFIFNRQVSE